MINGRIRGFELSKLWESRRLLDLNKPNISFALTFSGLAVLGYTFHEYSSAGNGTEFHQSIKPLWIFLLL